MSTNFATKAAQLKSSAPIAKTSSTAMSFKNFHWRDLPTSVRSKWIEWSEQPQYYSPYFRTEFAECVSRVRDDLHVTVAYRNDTPIAILPYQLASRKFGEPLGGAVNDYHGPICHPEYLVTAEELIRAAGLRRFKFHSWIRPDESILNSTYSQVTATVADFSDGFQQFHHELCQKSSTLKRHPQKMRKLSREVGPLRLELNCRDERVLDWVIQKKRDKYKRTGVVDFFGVDWTRNLMHELHRFQSDDFQGVLSALYAGDKLVAAHFGMRAGTTLHYWYPVYDVDYRRYSPGTQLFLDIAKESATRGVEKIDFGYGEDPYKDKLTNRSFQVARGCVDFNRFRSNCNKQIDQLACRIKSSPAKQPLKRFIRLFFPNAGQPRV
jgi:CelD/BcsL family acetyltransferase involved in cellulose biosynthesis